MLAELLLYARSLPRTPTGFRPALSDAIGLWARGQRQADAWRPHLERTRAAIVGGMAKLPARRSVAVLGSGPLSDVPLEALAQHFERVLLIDIAHLAVTDRRVRRCPNVEQVWRDLAPQDNAEPLAFLAALPQLDWVISINLVSQLGRGAQEGDERRTIDAHLDGLASLPMPVTLVADTGYSVRGRDGRVLETFDLMHGRPMPPASEQWEWNVAPFGEESPDTSRHHRVSAWPDWHAATNPFVR